MRVYLMKPDGLPVNCGIITHHSSSLTAKAKLLDTAGVLSFLWLKAVGSLPYTSCSGWMEHTEGGDEE